MLIVLTGIDGAGKSTAARALFESARAQGLDAMVLSNHAGRRGMSLLSRKVGIKLPPRMADAVETAVRVTNVIINHAKARRFRGLVIMDRHLQCQLALRQVRGIGRGRLLPWLIATLPTPDVIAYLDIEPRLALQRITERGTDEETLEDLTALRDAYRSLPEHRNFLELDAGASPEEVLAQLRRAAGIETVGVAS
ncbi:thymidylate kinase [Arthrobacter sp. SW1]|uniref:dTMP kinase n=1 Tax=Arthrobacter sp. SW1 TaxID=1920889 RepID=UPI000877B0FC|nr:dTMP kinase [Arthrobacter sp. SW1]OFI37110.1 thymidylate kinase [Arthrobacter sp. SW1]